MLWSEFTRYAVGFTLIFASIGKIHSGTSLKPFLLEIGLSPRWTGQTARVVPIVELVVGLSLLANNGWVWPAFAAAILTTAFALVLLWSMIRGIDEQCNCFGVLDRTASSTILSLIRSLILSSVAWLSVSLIGRTGDLADAPHPPTLLLGLLASAVYIAGFALLAQIVQFEQGRAAMLRRLHREIAND